MPVNVSLTFPKSGVTGLNVHRYDFRDELQILSLTAREDHQHELPPVGQLDVRRVVPHLAGPARFRPQP